MRDAARQRHQPRERDRAHQAQQRLVLAQKALAPRLAAAALGDEIGAPGGEEEAVAMLDGTLWRRALPS